jgi:hypothetical protein
MSKTTAQIVAETTNVHRTDTHYCAIYYPPHGRAPAHIHYSLDLVNSTGHEKVHPDIRAGMRQAVERFRDKQPGGQVLGSREAFDDMIKAMLGPNELLDEVVPVRVFGSFAEMIAAMAGEGKEDGRDQAAYDARSWADADADAFLERLAGMDGAELEVEMAAIGRQVGRASAAPKTINRLAAKLALAAAWHRLRY